jgi:hypothetical protein
MLAITRKLAAWQPHTESAVGVRAVTTRTHTHTHTHTHNSAQIQKVNLVLNKQTDM